MERRPHYRPPFFIMPIMKRHTLSYLTAIATLCLASCGHGSRNNSQDGTCCIDVDSIVSRGKLRVVTDYNTVNYFVYKGIPVGYQYELINEYAKHLGVEVSIIASNDNEHNIDMLMQGKVDIIATNLIADTVSEQRIAFAEPYGQSRQVLVQRVDKEHKPVRDITQLSGDTLFLLANSFYVNTVRLINDSLDVPITIEEIPNYDVEQIIQLVAEQEVGPTICLETIARANKWFYSTLDIQTPVTDEYDLSWGLRRNAPDLKADIDQWLAAFKKTGKFKQIFRKYVIDPREHHSNVQSTGSATYDNSFEEIVKLHATDKRYNWRLISSVIFQESHFNPEARSWAGACGLMQLMPETALRFGVDDPTDPEENIIAGIKFLMWLDERMVEFVSNDAERIKFALAAYNVGPGHIMDAIRLAVKLNLNPQVWDGNVEVALLHKANPTFYSDPVVKHGYCRGTETINYVRNIMERYHNYCLELKD